MTLALTCLSHSPLLDITAQEPELEADVHGALKQARDYVADFDPDVVVAFVPDHYNGFFYSLMPPFCLGTAASTVGDYHSLAGPLDVPERLALDLAAAVQRDGVDLAVSRRMKLDHGTAQPLRILFGGLDSKPVIPVFINCVAEPIAPLARARALGAAIGKFLAQRGEKILVVGSGGLSHDPPMPTPDTAPPPLAERLLSGRPLTEEEADAKHHGAIAEGRRLAAGTSTRHALDPDWDNAFLDILASGNLRDLDAWANGEIGAHGGGAHEIRTWTAAYAALQAAGPYQVTYRYYRPVPEYIAGFGVTTAQARGDDPPAPPDAGPVASDLTGSADWRS
jgi:2,3-dihydroxyphenylpropionate 1,2-dioxygenase